MNTQQTKTDVMPDLPARPAHWATPENPINFWANANGDNSKKEDALFNDLDPKHIIQRERPHHRRVVDMAMQGFRPHEIEAHLGLGKVTVSNILRQPWARERLIKHSQKTVTDELKELLESQALPSVQTLICVRDNDQAPAQARTNAANALLDRFLGKPSQHITTEAKKPSEMTDEELRAVVESEVNGNQSTA